MKIDLLGHLYYHAVYDEVGAVDELAGGFRRVIRCAVLGPHLIVDGILREVDVQFARIAVYILASEVIDAVGDVAGLLNFGKEVACSDGV